MTQKITHKIQRIFRRLLPMLLLPFLAGSALAADDIVLDREQLRTLIDEMVREHGMDRRQLQKIFAGIRYRGDIIEAITRPAEAKPWHEYRQIFLTSDRVAAGRRFWSKNEKLLHKAEQEFGVPAEIIVAIIGVETRFGRYQGKYDVVESLSTLAFHYPPRAAFFRKQLVEFLLLCKEEGLDPRMIKGSYAGAMGKPQFIPSSYRSYAVDFDGDGKRDLLNSTADAIGSVANYFRKHRWQPGNAVITRATTRGDNYQAIVDLGIKPSTPLAQMEKKGVRYSNRKLSRKELGALIELENTNGPEHWVGLQNFYVITRYNHSPLYAMAVYQLSQQIIAERSTRTARN